MIAQGTIWAYLLLSLVLASLPWVTDRLLMIKALTNKSVWVRLVEWAVYSLIALAAGWGLEWQLTGSLKDQDWEFYTSTLFMFGIMSFPGFIWYQQRKKQHQPVETV